MPGPQTTLGACVINLDGSRGRRHAMKAEFARAGLPWRRVRGVLPTAMPDHLAAFFMDGAGRRIASLTPGEMGCFAAHISISSRMVAGELEPVMLVLEDDCRLTEDLTQQLQGLLRSLPPDWDMVRLCNVPKRAYIRLGDLPSGHAIIRYSTIPNFTGAYLVSLAGARKLLAGGPKTLPFDGFLREAWRHDSNVYGVWPPMITQRHEDSCIDRIDQDLQVARDRPRDREGRVGIARRLAWQIGVLGFPAFVACQVVDIVDAVSRRLARRTLIHRAAPLLGLLHLRTPSVDLERDDAIGTRPGASGSPLDAAAVW